MAPPKVIQYRNFTNALYSGQTLSFNTQPTPGNTLLFIGWAWPAIVLPISVPSDWIQLYLGSSSTNPGSASWYKVATPGESNSYSTYLNGGRQNFSIYEIEGAVNFKLFSWGHGYNTTLRLNFRYKGGLVFFTEGTQNGGITITPISNTHPWNIQNSNFDSGIHYYYSVDIPHETQWEEYIVDVFQNSDTNSRICHALMVTRKLVQYQ